MVKRVLVSWEFPAGYCFKCVLKHLRLQGRSDAEVVAPFKWLVPGYQQIFDEERADRGLPPVPITDNRIKQRANKGSLVGYEREWPDLHEASKVYWVLAGLIVKANEPVGVPEVRALLRTPPNIDTASVAAEVPASTRIVRPRQPFPRIEYLTGDQDDLGPEIRRDLEYFDAIDDQIAEDTYASPSWGSMRDWLKRLSNGVTYGALSDSDRRRLHVWRDVTQAFYDSDTASVAKIKKAKKAKAKRRRDRQYPRH